MPRVSFLTIVNYLEELAANHVEINDCFRWNVSEVSGSLRSGVELPVMLVDAVDTQTKADGKKILRHNSTAFTILGKPNTQTGALDTYNAQNQVLDFCQQLCFDMEERILRDSEQIKDKNGDKNWLYGLVDGNSFHHFKVGPLFTDGLYGYRCELVLKNQASKNINTNRWNDL